jgi:hypothetical protein
MTVLTRWAAACLAATSLTGALAGPVAARAAEPAGSDAAGEIVTTTPRAAVESLPLADEVREGYERTKFRHWVDADRDGCNTRQEVLVEEAIVAPTVGERCALTGGLWYSYYDNLVWEDPSRLDIDHMVPLAEAWDSGASAWTAEERQAYANDLDEARALVAVTAGANRSKADQDPAEWLPPDRHAICRYITEWVVVKVRWGLTVDGSEQAALADQAQDCDDEPLTVTLAR